MVDVDGDGSDEIVSGFYNAIVVHSIGSDGVVDLLYTLPVYDGDNDGRGYAGIGDINSDGVADFVRTHTFEDRVSILLSSSPSTWELEVKPIERGVGVVFVGEQGGVAGLTFLSSFYHDIFYWRKTSVDINSDGRVDAADLAQLIASWQSGTFDITADGIVNSDDLVVFLSTWGACE